MENKSNNKSLNVDVPKDDYSDKKIQQEIASKDMIPDEVPRSDGPGGE
jgi:hypothetical protein